MTEFTAPINGLSLLAPGQALKHVTVNEALLKLDVLIQLTIKEKVDFPPDDADVSDIFIVGDHPEGDFTGQTGALAILRYGIWMFIQAKEGWRAYDKNRAKMIIFDGIRWSDVLGSSSADLTPMLGINTEADSRNRLSVKAEAVLLSHEGEGIQLKLNKSESTSTGSLIYQTGFSGRAEIGLTGSDSLQVKVSFDGMEWTNALQIDPISGVVDAPQGLTSAGKSLLSEDYAPGVLSFKGEIGNHSNLDSYQETGLYHQTSNGSAALGQNYPVPKAGLLSVVTNGSMSFQTYQVWSGAGSLASRSYTRGAYNGIWGAWRDN